MKFPALTSVSLLAAAAALSAGQAPPSSFFQNHYNQFNALTRKRDMPAIERMIRTTHTSDYVGIDSKKKKSDNDALIKAAETINRLVSRFDTVSDQVLKVEGKKNTANVTVKSVLLVHLKDRKGATHSFEDDSTSVDTWVRVGGKWLMKSSVTLSSRMLRDGQPIKPH